MKQLLIFIALIMWFLITLILCLSFVGAIALAMTEGDDGNLSWHEIGKTLTNKLIEDWK